jgi:hypothetical protein
MHLHSNNNRLTELESVQTLPSLQEMANNVLLAVVELAGSTHMTQQII